MEGARWRPDRLPSTDCAGYTLRTAKHGATGVNVSERVANCVDTGTVSYDKRDAGGKPRSEERVLAIKLPRRAWSSMTAAPPAARAWTGRHRMAVLRTTAGYMFGAYAVMKHTFDYHQEDVLFCTADC